MKKYIACCLILVMIIGLLPLNAFAAESKTTAEQRKVISVLGDSISTYTGYSNGAAAQTSNSTIGSGAVYYPRSGFDVTAESTWWYQAAQALEMDILVNNAWSGSCLLNTRSGTVGAYVDRCVQLHDDTGDNAGQQPDIIAIFLGTNDYYTYPGTLGTFDSIDFDTLISKTGDGIVYGDPVTSMEAYAIILDKISQAYPQAEVYCFTMLPRVNSTSQPTAFNEDITKLAQKYGATVVDLYHCGISSEAKIFNVHMGDNLHPNNAGMDAISNAFISAVLKNSSEQTTYDVRFALDQVVALEGTTRTVIAGETFEATLAGIIDDRQLNVCVQMNGVDITADCYADGVIKIPSVSGDVVVTASMAQRSPLNFCWEYDSTKDALVSVADGGNTENLLTMTGGSITDGKFSKVKYTLEEAVILKHDQPWILEWSSSGSWTDTTDGALLFAGAASSTTANTPYLYRRHNSDFIAFGMYTGGQYHNYGVSLKANGIDGTAQHCYRLANRVNEDGSNMVYLYVDGEEIAPMNHHWAGGTDKKETGDWLNGLDLVFTNMGTSPHTIGNCYIDYIRVWEDGHIHNYTSSITAPTCSLQGYTTYTCSCGDHYTDEYVSATGNHSYEDGICTGCGMTDPALPQSFRWECQDDQLISVESNGNSANPLTMTQGSITDGKFKNVKYTLRDEILLMHDRPWILEWTSEGTWTDTTDGALLFAGNASSSVADTPYLYRRHNSDFISFGFASGGRYYNYGVALGANGIDGTAKHTYRLVNRLFEDGSNMVYLFVDDQQIGPMNHHWIGGTDQKKTVDWLNGKDLVFTNMGTSPHTIGNCYIDYIQVWEDGHPHRYEDGICIECGAEDPDYVTIPTLTLNYPTLEFQDMINIVAFFTAENTENVVEMGMITYRDEVSEWNVDNAMYVIPGAGYVESSGRYYATSQGIHAKQLADEIYLAVYAKLTDGSYVYSKLVSYSATAYAYNQLKTSEDVKLKQLVVAMLNYGAEAQAYFRHNVEHPANASLSAEQLALPELYSPDMVQRVAGVPAEKQGVFINNQGFSTRQPAVSFEGAFCINYFFTPAYAPVGEITMYYWNEADFDAAGVLTAENASGTLVMKLDGTGQYRADITGIAAKNLSGAVYVAAVYHDGSALQTSGVLGYSIGAYCSSQAAKDSPVAALAKATAVYGYHAKEYFA